MFTANGWVADAHTRARVAALLAGQRARHHISATGYDPSRAQGRASEWEQPLGVPSWSSAWEGAGGWGRAVWGIPPVLSAPLLGPPCQLFQSQQRYVSLPRPNNTNTSFRSQSIRGTSGREEHIWSENVPGKQKPPSLPASQRKNWKGLFQMYVCWGIGEEAVYIC